jgi:hypothetical protein
MTHVGRWIKAILVADIVLAAIVVAIVASDRFLARDTGSVATPTPVPSKDLMAMGPAHIPTSNACVLCHTAGGEAGLKPVPALGHPLQGWTACLTCHSNDKLGRQAPGHVGIDESECTNCHKVAPVGPAITQAHSNLDKPCLECHGNVAHLPSSMVGRNTDDCALCHKPAAEQPPQKPHAYDPRLTCRSCHQSGNVGALPIDHALRSDATCLLCHDLKPGPVPTISVQPTPGPQSGLIRFPLIRV